MRFRAFLYLIFLVCGLILPRFLVSAQDTGSTYRFHQPTASEYLTVIPDIVAQWEVETAGLDYPPHDIFQPLVWDIQNHIPSLQDEDITKINLAYQALYRNNKSYFDYIDRPFWNQQILLAWLNQDDVVLEDGQFLRFHIYTLEVTARDFNADGEDEWLVLAKRGNEYEQNIVFRNGEEHRYELVPTPLPWFGCCFSYSQTPSGGVEELRFEDINDDGLPEWVLAYGGTSANHTNYGHLFVLRWNDGHLVEVAPYRGDFSLHYFAPAGGGQPPIIHPYVEWLFINTDNDSSLEIQQILRFGDNWRCTFWETSTFDWDSEQNQYQYATTTYDFEESWGCALRHAQLLMWEHDYEGAIPLLQQSIDLAPDEDSQDDRVQYESMRLALALSLTGDYDAAQRVLSDVLVQVPQTELIRLWQRQLSTLIDGGGLSLCQAMYTVAVHAEPWDTNIGFYGGPFDNGPQFVGGPQPDAIKAGCDFPFELERTLSETVFSTDRPVLEQLLALGITPRAVETFDLNSDGNLEWLIWTEPLVEPIFLAQVGSGYRLSRPDIRKPDSNTTVGIIELPNDAGYALVNRYYERFSFDGIGLTPAAFEWPFQFGCVPARDIPAPFNTETGFLRMWRLNVAELESVVDFWTCEDRATELYFPFGRARTEMNGWIEVIPENDAASVWVPTTYQWDDENLTYQPVPIEPFSVEFPHQPVDHPPTLFSLEITRVDTNDEEAIDELVSQIEVVLDYYLEHKSPREIAEVRYWYALLLTLQDRTDEAVEQYVHIMEEMPDSSWAMMAMLHLERVEE